MKIRLIIKILQDITKQEGSLIKIIGKLFHLKKYYNELQKGIDSGKIFHELNHQEVNLSELMKKFSDEDFLLINSLFNKDLKNFLSKQKLKTDLELDSRNGSCQLGLNVIYVEKPISGLWTTGRATFYIQTKKEKQNKISIEFQSIVPVHVTIGLEDKEITTIKLPKLSTRMIEFSVSSVTNEVSELSIYTDRLWLPNTILGTEKSVAIGIGIKSINVTYV